MKGKFIPCSDMSHILFDGKYLAFCCVGAEKTHVPRWEWTGSGTECMESFFAKREILLQEINGLREIDLLKPCLGCFNLTENKSENMASFGKINYLCHSYLPTFCQCKCIYCCSVNNVKQVKQDKFAAKLAEAMNYLEKNDLLADNFRIQISSGEITVHPERKELFHILTKYPCRWLTNAFIYSEAIAENLRNHKSSSVCVSLDCGTPETFKKVKSYDMYNKVIENLSKYNECGNLEIKYIVLPGINDSLADYNGIITLLKKFNLNNLIISRENSIQPIPPEALESLALLYSLCKANDIQSNYYYSCDMHNKIKQLAERSFEVSEIEAYENNPVRQYFRNKEINYTNYTIEYRYYFKARKLKKILNRKKAVIWGAGNNGTLLANLCSQNDIDIYITDRDESKHGKSISGKTVMSFSELADKVDTILLSNGTFMDSVKEQVGDKYDIIDFWALLSTL